MLASSVVIIWIVYANLVRTECPNQELCPGPDLINVTSKDTYYVDFPAASLAFISSWSSTFSFALVGYLMAMCAYATAASLLRASEKADQESLPSPHQMSVMLRILNAELMMLWSLAVSKVNQVFWHRVKDDRNVQRARPILVTTIIVLLAGIAARFVRCCWCQSLDY